MISIVVPVYNIENFISKCIDSILAQSCKDWELILVNDGSKDKSKEICERYCKYDKRIKLVNKDNGGLSSARNSGIKNAKGEWVMFLDGDDYLIPDCIETLYCLLKSSPKDLDVLQYGYQEISSSDSPQLDHSFNFKVDYISNQKEMFLRLIEIGGEAASGCTKLIRRSVFDKILFKEGTTHEDEEFTQRLYFEINKMGFISNFKPYLYVKRSGSIINSSFSKKRLDIIHILKERINLLRQNNLDEIIPYIKVRLLANLNVLYLAAFAAKDLEAKKYIIKELKYQIKTTNIKNVNINGLEKFKYKLTQYHIPVLFFEGIVREITRKQIKFN